MKLIILTKSTFFVEEDKILSALFDEGLDSLHLYKPGNPPMYYERLLTLLPEEYHRNITVHDHFYLKKEYDLAGIHIDEPTISVPERYKGKISRTCTNMNDLKMMKKTSNYVFLKNIFDCIEFKDETSTFTLETLENAAMNGLIDKKVYALGGMSIDNVKIAKSLGFGGVVICGDLWNRFDIHNEVDYKNIISHYERLRKAVG